MAPAPRRRPRTLLVAAVVTVSAVLAVAGTASAAWTSPASGAARATSTTVAAPGAPVATVTGRSVALHWSAVTMADGVAVSGYTVRRTSGTGAATVVAACSGTATSCTDQAVPPGSHTYTVTAGYRTWSSAPGPGAAVTVRGPVLTLPATASSLPATLTGTLTDAVAGAGLTFRLDDPATGVVLAATPAVVAPGASTDVAVVLPAGTVPGSHRIYALAAGEVTGATVAVVTNGTPTALAWLGNGDGRARTGDSLRVTYSQPLDLAALAPSDPDGDLNVVVSVLDGAGPNGHDLLTVTGSGGAPVAFGDIDLGSSAFVVNDVTFGATDTPSTLRWSPTARTLTLVFGRESNSSAKTVSTAVSSTYRPSPVLRTSTGGAVTGSVATVAIAF